MMLDSRLVASQGSMAALGRLNIRRTVTVMGNTTLPLVIPRSVLTTNTFALN